MSTDTSSAQSPRDVRDIETWLIGHIANELKREGRSIDPTEPLVILGLDSVSAVTITGELEQWLGIRVSPTVPWDYPTIRELAIHLVAELERAQ